MKNVTNIKRIICIILILSLCTMILSGCSHFENLFSRGDNDLTEDTPHIDTDEGTDSERFDRLMDELFADWVSNDSLSMNFFLADPEAMGIERPAPTFGEVITPEMIARERERTQELSEKLDSFNYDSLTGEQQVIHDIISRSVALSQILDREENFAFYTGYIRPLTGLQVQLPVLLAEFTFYTAEDIERYLQLLGDTTRYFNDIIDFERERAARGFFMSIANTDSVIEQLESFLEHREDNFLIIVFDDKIDAYEGLSSEQREQYKQRNRQLVLDNVLYAYDNLLEAMRELRGVGARTGGIAELPRGREFAHAMLRLRTGTDRTPAEIDRLLDEWIQETITEIWEILDNNDQVNARRMSGQLGQIEEGTAESYMSILRTSMGNDFPPLLPTNYVIQEVHESLQEHMSPAFYLTPAIDNFDDNVIYTNPSQINDDLFLFTVMAHEGYPGHMYQTVYYLQQSPHPVRTQFSNSGYKEGWATYVEMLSYHYSGLEADEATLLWNNRFYGLLIQAHADFRVNVLGWDLDQITEMFFELDIRDSSVAENIFDMVTGVPLHTMLYVIGFIELIELLEYAEDTLRGDFEILEFHRFFLDIGPTPFSIIRANMYEWMAYQ